jgi:hypothetical protein
MSLENEQDHGTQIDSLRKSIINNLWIRLNGLVFLNEKKLEETKQVIIENRTKDEI